MYYISKVWEKLNYFQSAEISQQYLKKAYYQLDKDTADMKSYENCYPFMYFLEHGEMYYKQAEVSPIAIKPVLLFYGLVQLIKACLLTVDPNYPETTSVLAHGVSSRKRKKQQYRFINDEVKIQKMGLCTHFASKMFHMEQLDGEKVFMNDLFLQIPEMNDCFMFNQKKQFIEVKKNNHSLIIPTKILDQYHMTLDRFHYFLETKGNFIGKSIIERDNNILISIQEDTTIALPFRYNIMNNSYSLPIKKNQLMFVPDLIIYYLLSYNLSMIARYETEWWSELLKTTPTNDYPLIKTFLSIMSEKTPYLIHEFLNKYI